MGFPLAFSVVMDYRGNYVYFLYVPGHTSWLSAAFPDSASDVAGHYEEQRKKTWVELGTLDSYLADDRGTFSPGCRQSLGTEIGIASAKFPVAIPK
jgi:hypothetical protein